MMPQSTVRPFEVTHNIRVNGYDIDFAGIVSNIVYVRWLEDIRTKWLDTYLPLKKQTEDGYLPVLYSTYIEYHRPIRIFDEPVGALWLTKIGKARWTVEIEIVVAGKVTTVATQTGVFVDSKTLRPVEIPKWLREGFEGQQAKADR